MASGPSLCAEDVKLVRQWRKEGGGKVAVVNTTFRMAPWADLLYACDGGWWRTYGSEVNEKFTGDLMFTYAQYGERFGAKRVKSVGRKGLSRNTDTITTGGNSGHQCIHAVRNLGAKRIILLGFDMAHTYGQAHWHGNHPRGLGNAGQCGKWIELMRPLAAGLEAEGVEVINCSRHTALDCFKRAGLADTLCAS